MTNNFELEDGAVRVAGPTGSYRPIVTPKGFTDEAFRNALAAVYTLFMRDGSMPTVADCFAEYGKIPSKTYSALFVTPEFKEALEYRGVKFDPRDGLSLEQRSALLALEDLSDGRSLKTKLTELHIPWGRYQAWLKDPLFSASRNRQTEEAYGTILPELRQVAISKALNGSDRMLELIFAKTGEYDPRASDVQDARKMIYAVLDAVNRHVVDSSVRAAILADVRSAIVGFEAVTPPQMRQIGG